MIVKGDGAGYQFFQIYTETFKLKWSNTAIGVYADAYDRDNSGIGFPKNYRTTGLVFPKEFT